MVLTVVLVSSAVLKIVFPAKGPVMLDATSAYGVAVLECGLGVALWTRWSRPAAAITIVMAAVGLLIGIMAVRSGRPCGCWGVIEVGWRVHAALCATMGILASVSGGGERVGQQ